MFGLNWVTMAWWNFGDDIKASPFPSEGSRSHRESGTLPVDLLSTFKFASELILCMNRVLHNSISSDGTRAGCCETKPNPMPLFRPFLAISVNIVRVAIMVRVLVLLRNV